MVTWQGRQFEDWKEARAAMLQGGTEPPAYQAAAVAVMEEEPDTEPQSDRALAQRGGAAW